MPRLVFLLSMLTVAFSIVDLVSAQAPPQAPPQGPTFDVVSIKKVPAGTFPTPMRMRPDGGLSFSGSAATLIRLAYPPGEGPSEIVGLPDWVTRERYAVDATASLPKMTRDDMAAMLRAMLADRFKLLAHVEKRDIAAPSVFTAVREQLGLKLESSKAVGDVVVVDRLEQPTEN